MKHVRPRHKFRRVGATVSEQVVVPHASAQRCAIAADAREQTAHV
jgi:hypothetical protein